MNKTEKWARLKYQPCLPLGDNRSLITGCQKHIDLSRKAAGEGAVLLKNEGNILPLEKGTKVAVFGKAQIDYVKGGGGSGDVHSEYVRNIYEGLMEKADQIEVYHPLSLFYKNFVLSAYKRGEENGNLTEAEIPEQLIQDASAFTDTAIITINRYSAEGSDRKNDGMDPYFVLSDIEKRMVEKVCANFVKVVVLLNTGAMIDTSWFADNERIQAALMIWQGGMEGALSAADILTGEVNPSGKLVDTCAYSFEDYPSSEGFHESEDYVKYTEDIFVGYRYFETIPGKKQRVVYPFGFGLSYTTFAFNNATAVQVGEKIFVSVDVNNTGDRCGKEVVQLYYAPPAGRITKPALALCGFAKTKLLAPGERQTVQLVVDIRDMASYDDIGTIEKSAYILERGVYRLLIGNSIRNVTELEYQYVVEEDTITEKCTEYCAPQKLGKRLLSSGEYVTVPDAAPIRKRFEPEYQCPVNIPASDKDKKNLIDVYHGKVSLDDFIAQLTDDEMMALLVGQKSIGVANTDGMGNLPKYGIPNAMTTDGPAGVRILPETGVRTTAFPVATMLACTWNLDIVEEVGKAGALEAKENNLAIWLTPALNIHRSPLCGRNFEYFSEDPYVSGKMAAAMVRGIQSQGIVATPKHFACNNKETNRHLSDSIVSERALREIYIKGFEICVKEANPKLVMTSYNVINGVRAAENAELITGILRREWGYKGLVTTDWWTVTDRDAEVRAGNDIRMPSTLVDFVTKYIDATPNKNTRHELAVCVKRLLEMLLWLE